MDPVLQGISADLIALDSRVIALGAEFLALKLKAAAFVKEQAALPDAA